MDQEALTENTSHSTAELSLTTIMLVQYYCSYNSQMKCFWTHVDMHIFSCCDMQNS
jgi:hypothetical protein